MVYFKLPIKIPLQNSTMVLWKRRSAGADSDDSAENSSSDCENQMKAPNSSNLASPDLEGRSCANKHRKKKLTQKDVVDWEEVLRNQAKEISRTEDREPHAIFTDAMNVRFMEMEQDTERLKRSKQKLVRSQERKDRRHERQVLRDERVAQKLNAEIQRQDREAQRQHRERQGLDKEHDRESSKRDALAGKTAKREQRDSSERKKERRERKHRVQERAKEHARRDEERAERLRRDEQHRRQVEEQNELARNRQRALRLVRAAERDRQRLISPPELYHTMIEPPPRDEYSQIDEEIPPYNASLHKYLDLMSYDERFAPCLRVNRYLVHGENELTAAIHKFSQFNLLPKRTDLWSISHVDDRDYENMIPVLIPEHHYHQNVTGLDSRSLVSY